MLTFVAMISVMPGEWQGIVRETAFDMVLAADRRIRHPVPDGVPLAVIDIDRRSLEALGPWPWPRDRMATLVEAVSAGQPKVIAIDILFAEADMRSPAALARQLGSLTGNPEITSLAGVLPDGDKRLSSAIRSRPVALGFVLDSSQLTAVPGVPVLSRGPILFDDIWQMPAAIAPLSPVIEAAAGLGVLSLPGDADGKVRRVPLFVGVGDTLRPGLALEAVRLLHQASSYIVESQPPRLLLSDLKIPLSRDGLLRLAPVDISEHEARTISAIDIIRDGSTRSRLAGAVAFVGGSAPELGGLRETPGDPLVASVQLQADAMKQIVAQQVPRHVPFPAELALTLVIGVIGLVAAVLFPPIFGVSLVTVAIGATWLGAVLLSVASDRLVDPLIPSLGAFAAFATTSVGSYAVVSRREARIRSRFEQHLSPEVVRRIAEEPGILKLRGERREVTALFTDIEDFTAMTHRAEPEQLVAVLDGYIEGVATTVMAHGGMVEKIVGDSVHALFNAPVDLADHPRRAVDCAIEIRNWVKTYRTRPEAVDIGLGRTRIGIETGPAIVGDIGIRSKLDYTAHGDAINSAARLEALNKQFGSTICVGPMAASRCEASLFRPLGVVVLRGLDAPVAVFEPWPSETSVNWRERYLAAHQAMEARPAEAVLILQSLVADCPLDPVVQLRLSRLTGTHNT
ncbi:CHASE2 domain-containing protein [Bradyrhizobium sp.]|uniref:CHASE2 domain-containing protein n=1 Tax=Bradyrhizobium sp. TaxID=376 RepID=UPI003C73F928